MYDVEDSGVENAKKPFNVKSLLPVKEYRQKGKKDITKDSSKNRMDSALISSNAGTPREGKVEVNL